MIQGKYKEIILEVENTNVSKNRMLFYIESLIETQQLSLAEKELKCWEPHFSIDLELPRFLFVKALLFFYKLCHLYSRFAYVKPYNIFLLKKFHICLSYT